MAAKPVEQDSWLEVLPGKIYQIRGFDLANMTFIRTEQGWVIIDVETSNATAKTGYGRVEKFLGDFRVFPIYVLYRLFSARLRKSQVNFRALIL